MTKIGALASALHNSGANVAAVEILPQPVAVESKVRPAVNPGRRGTFPITVHFPKEVRRQLKILAAEQDKHIETMVAEALNLLFAKYRKGEIAPVKQV
jgi:hypothetical protein